MYVYMYIPIYILYVASIILFISCSTLSTILILTHLILITVPKHALSPFYR